MSFASLKKQSNLGSLTAKLVKEVEKVNNASGGGDDRLWKPELDKSDPDAKRMKEDLLASAKSMGLPANVDISKLFDQMSDIIGHMKEHNT